MEKSIKEIIHNWYYIKTLEFIRKSVRSFKKMGFKSTILTTKENEHWYKDASEPLTKQFNAITLEFNKSNIRIDVNDSDDLIITIINPNCDLYKIVSKLEAHDDK